ncbi:MAG TPA: XRE family transcriptional regulator [Bacteroidetes bacterium]|nr:MAG: transcriptional regulator [Deltaproteobacteria bacterium GWB2_55_19]OGP34650.1 MAG: transcriptional regulator [Deltaproteobacteria bacterium GWC2_56_8]HCA79038.1 XRE family transcriptional regulator [Bacteroidota bacterium]
MIKCHLSRFMGERKIKIAELARATDIHRNMLTLLYFENAKRIEFDVMEKLCRYFNCAIQDLFEIVDESEPATGIK